MVETIKGELQMSKQAGLSDRGRFEAFSSQWRDTVAKEAEKWCSNGQSVQLLTDAVLADFQRAYAEKEPPRRLEYYLRAQVCLVYSQTGQSPRKLREYLAGQEFFEDEGAAPETEEPAAEAPAAESTETSAAESAEAQPEPEEQAEPAAEAATVEAEIPALCPEPAPLQAEDAVRPAEAAPPETVPASPSPAADKAPKTPDTFLDPVRTSYWTPNEERSSHIVQEVELPDEEDEPRSVGLSFLNTVLFLVTAAAFGFCVYETGFLQYLLQ